MSKVNEMLEHFSNTFMSPQCYKGTDIEAEIIHAGLDCEHDSFYCRLSADGCLDCTEWFGPFDNLEDCAEFLLENFA